MEGCLAQRQEAQRDLFELYFGYAKSICLRYSSNREEAEEVLNTGFLKIFQNLEKYDPIQPFRAWLRTIMINTAIDYYRKEQKHSQNIPLGDTIDVPFDDNVLDKISAEEILELVQQLPNSYRTVFMLYVVDGYNHREIGELLGISEGTSKSNLAVARTKLKNMLLKKDPKWDFLYSF
ncbi:MAG: RNA polymerase sigma factor [Bacteroidia bacterium]